MNAIFDWRLWAISVGVWAINPICLTGCASFKAVDSTKFAQAVTAGESQVTYVSLNKELGLSEGDLVIPTIPGKDVQFNYSKHADGSIEASLNTSRSAVLDILAAGIAGLDAQKFAENEALRAWLSQTIRRAAHTRNPAGNTSHSAEKATDRMRAM